MPSPRDTDRHGRPVRGTGKPKWVDTAHDIEPPTPAPEPPAPLDDSPEPADEPHQTPETAPAPQDPPEPATSDDVPTSETFTVRARMTWRTAWRALAFG